MGGGYKITHLIRDVFSFSKREKIGGRPICQKPFLKKLHFKTFRIILGSVR